MCMKVSDKLQSQIDRLKKTGSFHIQVPEKHELADLIDTIGANPLLNIDCGTCVRRAMWDIISHQTHVDTTPKLQFKGVKDPESMSYKELRQAVKDKGLLTKYMKKEQMIKALKNVL